MNANKKLIARLGLGALLTAVLIAAAVGAGASLAYFRADTAAVENTFLPMALDIAVVENDVQSEETRTGGFSSGSAKKVSLQNKAGAEQVDAYLRCALVPVWRESAAGSNASLAMAEPVLRGNRLEYACADGSTLSLLLDENWAQHWVRAQDGWFYYLGAVPPGQTTAPLLQSVNYTTANAVLELQVLADGVQADGTRQPDWSKNCRTA